MNESSTKTVRTKYRPGTPTARHWPLLAAVAAVAMPAVGYAANGTWNGSGGNGNWSNSGNWASSVIPGIADSGATTNNTDTATFNAATGGNQPVVIDAGGRNLQNIAFGLAATGAYTIGTTGGPSLLLTTGGSISSSGSVVNPQIINAPLVLEGASGTYAVTNNMSLVANTITLGGTISGGAAGSTVLTLNGSNTGINTASGLISDGAATTLGITKSGAGTWWLTNGSNSYTGTTSINQGALVFSSLSNLGSGGGISFAGGTLTWNTGNTADISARTVTIGAGGATLNTNGNNVTLANAVGNGGSGSLTKTGGGTLTLSAAAGWTGTTGLNGGSVVITNVNQVSSGTLSFGGAGLTLTGTLNFANPVAFASSTTLGGTAVVTFSGSFTNSGSNRTITSNLNGSLTLSGNIYLSEASGTGRTLLVQGNATSNTTLSGVIANFNGSGQAGGLTLNPSTGGVVTLSNANLFTGLTTLTNGTLKITNAAGNSLATSSGVAIATATTAKLDLAGTNQSIVSLSGGTGASGGAVTNSSAGTTSILSITGNGGSYAGSIQNTGTGVMALTKSGSGTQTLTGANAYTGGTVISGGTLVVGPGGRLGLGSTASVTVDSGGILELNTSTGIDNAATLSIATAGSPNVILDAGVNEFVGTLVLGASTFTTGTFGATGSGALHIDDTYFSGSGIVTVPEPASFSLAGLAAVGLLHRRRRRGLKGDRHR